MTIAGVSIAVVAALLVATSVRAADFAAEKSADVESCLGHIANTETELGIPTGLLAAIGLAESGRTTASRDQVAWPWTVNVQGEGRYFETKEAAIEFVNEKRAEDIESIDVGCMQVNLKHHPQAFGSLEDAFDPEINVAYAAKFLTELNNEARDWMAAAQRYHSATAEKGKAYGERVAAIWRSRDPDSAAQMASELDGPQLASSAGSTETVAGKAARKMTVGNKGGLPVVFRLFDSAAATASLRPVGGSAQVSRSQAAMPRIVPGTTGMRLADYWSN